MSHLKQRLCLVPFAELVNCPEMVHFAIGSPYFDAKGQCLVPDPVVVAVRSDIVEPDLPKCQALAVSCNTRPYQSYGPVIRKVFEASQPHNYQDVRRGIEGVMEVGAVRAIPPGALADQAEEILLGCVAPMTGTVDDEILNEVLGNLAKEFSRLPMGVTLRMPLIGTGKARNDESTEEVYRETVNLTSSYFSPFLLPADKNHLAPRRLLFVHPFEYESRLIASMLVEKAIFHTILDKMNISTLDKRFVYGLAHGPTPQTQLVTEENFASALDHLDGALDELLAGTRKKALQKAAQAVELEPNLEGAFAYIASLAKRANGLGDAFSEEAILLAKKGRVRDAFSVVQVLDRLGAGRKQQQLIDNLRRSYLHYGVAAMEARLLYEKYMETEETLASLYQGRSIDESHLAGSMSVASEEVREKLLSDPTPLQTVKEKIPGRMAENVFHIVIRKFMAPQIELQGARRALDNLLDLNKHQKIQLREEDIEACHQLYKVMDYIESNREELSSEDLRKEILEQLEKITPHHGTFRLEAGRYYLSRQEGRNLTRADLVKAWEHLASGYQSRPRDYGILSYLGFIVLLQGGRFLPRAEEFFTLLSKLLHKEVTEGRFSLFELSSPHGEKVTVPMSDDLSQRALAYYQIYYHNAQDLAKLSKALYEAEGTAAVALYRKVIDSLEEVGRYDLARLYESVLGETWVALLSRNNKSLGTIPLPFGELSLDFMLVIYKKIRFWWKYGKLRSKKMQAKMESLIEAIGKKM